jgi:hypothetical protein
MLMLPGPTKVDLVFPSEQREWAPAWEVTPDTLEAIDRHFWDWALWLEQKRRGGSVEQYEKSLHDLFELLLRPVGVAARESLERRFGLRVPRPLEREVRPALASAGPGRL